MAHKSQGLGPTLPPHQQVLGMTSDTNGRAQVHLFQKRDQILVHCLD